MGHVLPLIIMSYQIVSFNFTQAAHSLFIIEHFRHLKRSPINSLSVLPLWKLC